MFPRETYEKQIDLLNVLISVKNIFVSHETSC